MDVVALLQYGRGRGSSDLHLVVGMPPMFRTHGNLEPAEDQAPVTPEDAEEAVKQLATREGLEDFHRTLELDFGLTLPVVGRVRCNVFQERRAPSLVIRLLSTNIPSLDELGLPQVCRDLVSRPRGLVIVTGPTGSGKSTTLAAMIEHLNATYQRSVVTIEDPIEYLYKSELCAITQRELGTDTLSFGEALRHVLRQDPNVILVGEMRDTETAAAVINVAETGHLVLTTGHAPSTTQAVERVVDLFPPHERSLVQSRMASLLVGVLCQSLVPRANGKGRAAAVEVMLGNTPVRNLIREGKIHQLPNVLRTHAHIGMITLDQALANMYLKGTINAESLFAFGNDRDELEKLTGARRDAAKVPAAPEF